jgi:hypothetical protein
VRSALLYRRLRAERSERDGNTRDESSVLLERQPGRNGDQQSELSVGKIEQRRHGYSRLESLASPAKSRSSAAPSTMLSAAASLSISWSYLACGIRGGFLG